MIFPVCFVASTFIQSQSQVNPGANIEMIPGTNRDQIDVDAIIQLDPQGPLDRAVNQVIGETLLAGTRDYGKADFDALTGSTGNRIRCEVLPDAIHIWFSIRPSDAVSLPNLLDNLLFHASLNEDDLNKSISNLKNQNWDYWKSALYPAILPFSDIRVHDITDEYSILCNPSRIFVTIKGPVEFANLPAKINALVEQEPALQPPRHLRDPLPYEFKKANSRPLDSLTLVGNPIQVNKDFPANLIAMFCLGSGKGSILFQSVRQKLGWSYRQEADFIGSCEGLRPTIVVILKTSHDILGRSMELRKEITGAINALTEQDRMRAAAMAEAVLTRSVGMNPLDSISEDSDSELFLDSYWRMKTGSDWDADQLIRQMDQIPLDDLKLHLLDIVNSSTTEVIAGS